MAQPHFPRLDLGFRGLLPEWRDLLSPAGLKHDLRAGLKVAAVSLPLTLAVAFASGVAPFTGLVSAVVAGVVCALFGGTPLSISAPGMAMAVLVAAIHQAFGMTALLVLGLGAGFLQLLTGVMGFGRLWRYVPAPVIAGFTAGIGALVLIGQVPSALGLAPPEQSHIFEVLTHISNLLDQTDPLAAQLSFVTLLIALVWPTYVKRVPAPLVALVAPSVLAHLLQLPVQTLGAAPFSLAVSLPSVRLEHWGDLASACFLIYALASLETLLAASGVAKIVGSQRQRPDQELIGQGLGNMAAALMGGIPVTGAFARSALNVHAGAKTRRASIFQALLIAATAAFGGSLVGMIPTAVLAGLALSVALRMVHPREVQALWATSRGEAVAYIVTFLAIILVDLAFGIQTGIFAALAIVAVRLARTRARVRTLKTDGPVLLQIEGPLTFLAPLEGIRGELAEVDLSRGLVIDLARVDTMDGPGAAQLRDLVQTLQKRGVRVALQGASDVNRTLLLAGDVHGVIAGTLAETLPEAHRKVRNKDSAEHLTLGVQKFRATLSTGQASMFRKLADSQAPHTLFITCSDSRIDPNLITSTAPGELFIVRNVGNLVPPFGTDETPAEGAAVEFSVGILGVKDIIVCGHSGCGAMKAILAGDIFLPDGRIQYPSLSRWLQRAADLRDKVTPNATPAMAAGFHALRQLENLKSYPLVKERLAAGQLRLHAWYFDIGEARLQSWDPVTHHFHDLGSRGDRELEKRVQAGVQYQAPLLGPIAPPET